MGTAQREQLRDWLLKESLTYREARARLQTRFGVQSSDAALSNFYSRQCAPARPAPDSQAPLLDIVLESTRPVRLKILHCAGRLKVITKPASRRSLTGRKTINCGGEG